MGYIKLSSRLRRELEEIGVQKRLSGYACDLRWLEQSAAPCPVCGGTGGRASAVSVLTLTQNMTYVPFVICESCVEAHPDGFEMIAVKAIEFRILTHLKLSQMPFLDRAPDAYRSELETIMMKAAQKGVLANPTWIQTHPDECPACGQTGITPHEVRVLHTQVRGFMVAVPYLLCTDCRHKSESAIKNAVYPTLYDQVLRMK